MMSDANELRAKLAGVAYAQTLVATSTVDRIIAVILPIIYVLRPARDKLQASADQRDLTREHLLDVLTRYEGAV